MQTWAELDTVMQVDVAAVDGEYQRCSLIPRDGVDLRPIVFKIASEKGWQLRELTRGRHTLEDIFIRVTRAEEEQL